LFYLNQENLLAVDNFVDEQILTDFLEIFLSYFFVSAPEVRKKFLFLSIVVGQRLLFAGFCHLGPTFRSRAEALPQ
jgi:hypothetical protein